MAMAQMDLMRVEQAYQVCTAMPLWPNVLRVTDALQLERTHTDFILTEFYEIVSVETDVKMFIIAQTHENSYILTDPHHRCVCNFNKYSQTMLPPLHWRNHIQRHIKTANKQTYDHVMLLG